MAAVEVILLERIEKLGKLGDVVRVKPGFARNYLLPQHKALRATKANVAYFETKRVELEARNLERKGEAQVIAQTLDGLKLTLVRQASESGQLYGSVAARDLQDALKAEGFKVERVQINLPQAIKTLGLFVVPVNLHPEVVVSVSVAVARSADDAAAAHAKAAAAPEALLDSAEDEEVVVEEEVLEIIEE